ncbi:DegT/DnrJ/EryC1/StrS family aminotransferase [Nocardiopsis lambiniae]|uniref:DegT/DnrJ/EryC1/StrS family aminotransferase n=1 Tax=Nocardiopsis lambiniae TaxID=3075539 RepID=A0ABU2M6M7_9ACTN|nr:DegT/DnrJ/EryC1/StrS family aminotransferase [Nocardiopsis sp. DSM 44743]MDT0328328.1 DegT/DnrJ/EryC1/StrS family aminotransferase [Nocardiopsis sp. DSM 44743]
MTVTVERTIPFFPPDLFETDREALLATLYEVGTDPEQKFILGRRTARFEDALRASLGSTDVVACSSGTSALTLILAAVDIGPGDEVVVPAFGCAPLASTVLSRGAVPVFADIDPLTLTMDPGHAGTLVTDRTRALMPAHMFSVMADMPRLRDLASRAGVRLIEDSALAQGGSLAGRPAGRWGDAGVYSFVQVKVFGMPGEGGVVLTDDAELAGRVRMLRNHGQDGRNRFLHHHVGHNSRFDEVMAAFQSHRLAGLPSRVARRTEICSYYSERFADLAEAGVVAPPVGGDGRFPYVYTLLCEDRDGLRDHLAAEGVDTHVYYPRILPEQPAFAPHARLDGSRRPWPRAREAARRNISLPLYPHLTDAHVEHVAAAVRAFAHGRKR